MLTMGWLKILRRYSSHIFPPVSQLFGFKLSAGIASPFALQTRHAGKRTTIKVWRRVSVMDLREGGKLAARH
jgi:hypothetical protein